MKHATRIVVGAAAVAIVLLFYWLSRIRQSSAPVAKELASPSSTVLSTPSVSASPKSTAPSIRDDKQKLTAIVEKVFTAPISFFGRVQDQYGAPITGAKVEFGAIDRFWEAGSNYQTVSNGEGYFSITGINGAGLTVGVSKQGYDGLNGLSYQSFGYGLPPDSTRKIPPTSENPAIFILRKKGPTERLIRISRDVIIPKNGIPVEISLRTGKPVGKGNGDIIIECWTSDEDKDAQGHYEWHARVSVPGGGLVERTDSERDFEAPETGYQPNIEIGMPKNTQQWRRNYDSQYWLLLRDHSYARMRFRLTTGGDHFATIEAYLNPSGSRNLEFDENN